MPRPSTIAAPPPRKIHQPTNWQDATSGTVARIQQIFALHPLVRRDGGRIQSGLSDNGKILLYTQAHQIVAAQGKTTGATEYWNTFVNTLRTLVAGMTEVDSKDIFDN